jgi:hypothetical protein
MFLGVEKLISQKQQLQHLEVFLQQNHENLWGNFQRILEK